jgi:diaminohydroxyphosphoribosylaminopyrimidine deaminase/5-amino-6-(5-phosphoribosylamino)uracil reductase
MPLDSRILATAGEYQTIIAYTDTTDNRRLDMITEKGAILLLCMAREEGVNMADLLRKLGERGIDSVLLEGGGELNFSCLNAGLVDEVYAFIAPKYIGGRTAKTPVEGAGIEYMRDAIQLQDVDVRMMGGDVLVHGKTVREITN